MAWVIGFIVVVAVLVFVAGRRNRRDRPYDLDTQGRIGTHGVEVGPRNFEHRTGGY